MRRRFPTWLPLVGAFVGVAILAVRLATVPLDETNPYLAILVLGVAGIMVVFTIRVMRRRGRLRGAERAYPHALVIPIVVGLDTAAATRWLATHLPDPSLALQPDRHAIAVVDAGGLRLLDGTRTSAVIPTSRLSVLPVATARVGLRQVDALPLGVAVDGVVTPLPLVPTRANPFAVGPLTDAELVDVSARIRDAWAGAPETTGWHY